MRKRLCLILFALSVVFGAMAQSDTVVFSVQGGFYDDVFALELFNNYPQHHIRYTTNGNKPTAESSLYEEPLLLDASKYSKSDIYTIINCPEQDFYLADSVQRCIVIRAAVFDENDSCIGPVTTQSYFIRADYNYAGNVCAERFGWYDGVCGEFHAEINSSGKNRILQ